MKNSLTTLCLAVSMLVPSTLMAGKTLNDDEIRALFTGKTFDGHNVAKDVNYRAYSAADGSMIHQNPNRTKNTEWKVENGEHCAKLKGWRCGTIVDMGGGVYHKMNDGEHINTLTNFVDGNKL